MRDNKASLLKGNLYIQKRKLKDMFEGITFKTVKSLPIKDIDYSNFFVQYKNVQIAKTKYYDELQKHKTSI